MVEVCMRDYAVAMPLDPENRVLLQNKTNDYYFWPDMWCTFGGGVKENEDPLVALKREMGEENGLNLTEVQLFDSREYSDSGTAPDGKLIVRVGITHYFGAKFDGDISKVVLKEGGGFKKFGRDELVRYNGFGLVVPSNFKALSDFYSSLRRDE